MLDPRDQLWPIQVQDLIPDDTIHVRSRQGGHDHYYRVLSCQPRTLTLAHYDDPTARIRKSTTILNRANPRLMARPITAEPTSMLIARELLHAHPATRALRAQIARAAYHHQHGNIRAEHEHTWVCLHDLTRVFLHPNPISRRVVVDHFLEQIGEHYPYRSPLLTSFVESSQHLLTRALRPT